jgi:hypothetical protein
VVNEAVEDKEAEVGKEAAVAHKEAVVDKEAENEPKILDKMGQMLESR